MADKQDRQKKDRIEEAREIANDYGGAPDLPGGAMNSEHESETSGMRRSAAVEGSAAEQEGPASEEDRRVGDVHNLSTTSYTHMDRVGARGGNLAPRTPEEMSLHDELSRVAQDRKQKKAPSQDPDRTE